MKSLQIIHAVVTLLLLVAILTFGALTLCGIMEVRMTDKARANRTRPNDPPAHPTIDPVRVKAWLVVVRGAKPNTEYPIYDGQNVLGRGDEKPVDIDLQIQESQNRIWSSRQHAVITCANGALAIEDLNSSNGTYVNRNRVRPGQKQPLKADDIIQIGEVQLKVLLQAI